MDFEVDFSKLREDGLSILKDVAEVFGNRGITFWLDQGTALGAGRNGDFIPWEDDIDLSVWKHDTDKNPEVWNDFRKAGFNVFFYRKVFAVKLERTKRDFGWRSVDLHLYQREGALGYHFFNGPRHPRFLKFLFDVLKPIDMISELRHGPDIGLKNVKPLIKLSNYNQPSVQVEYKTLCEGNSATLNSFLRAVSPLFPDRALFLLKHFFSQIRLTFCSNPLRAEVPIRFIEPLKAIDFLGVPTHVPNPLDEYLALKYGEHWREPDPEWDAFNNDGALIMSLNELLESRKRSGSD